MYQSLLLWSQAQGIGKSLLGQIMGRIYGENFSEVSKDELTSQFNGWCVNKQFILGDEITGSDSKREADKLKGLITREYLTANEKHQATYPLRDCANYLLTSNHENAVFITDNDRRFAIHHVGEQPKPDKFYLTIDKWMRSDVGPSALFYYLLNEIDLTDFNPRSHAPETEAKREMLDINKSSLEMQLEDLLNNPNQYLKLGREKLQRDVYTVTEILALLPDSRANMANFCSRLLTKLRVPKCKVTSLGIHKRLVAVRNPDKWRRQPGTAWAENYKLDFKEPKYEK